MKMNMHWKRRGDFSTIEQVIEANTGQPIEKILNPDHNLPIACLRECAQAILDAVDKRSPIVIFGDYDCDGITSTAILAHTLRRFGSTPVIKLPKRFSEGYGLSEKAIQDVNRGLVITIDNGISAIEPISILRDRGVDVIVIDHHLPREDGLLPNANILLDPWVTQPNGYTNWCGAGLAYRVACEMNALRPVLSEGFLKALLSMAAIGTVADVCSLLDENRYIVKEGILAIRQKYAPVGFLHLIESYNIQDCSVSDIGFKIGPTINAPGRLFDDGAMQALKLIYNPDGYMRSNVESLIRINDKRKQLVSEAMEAARLSVTTEDLHLNHAIVLYPKDRDAYVYPEGIAGIIAGRIAEEYHLPTIVLTQGEDPNVLKGSARSYGGIHIKEVLDTISHRILRYGGHAGAAGLSVERSAVEAFIKDLNKEIGKRPAAEAPDTLYYDLEIHANGLRDFYNELSRYEPFGEGIPSPVVCIKNFPLSPRYGNVMQFMGKNDVKLYGKDCSAVFFDGANKFKSLGCPKSIDVIGTVFINRFKGHEEVQIEVLDIRESDDTSEKTELFQSLKSKLSMTNI